MGPDRSRTRTGRSHIPALDQRKRTPLIQVLCPLKGKSTSTVTPVLSDKSSPSSGTSSLPWSLSITSSLFNTSSGSFPQSRQLSFIMFPIHPKDFPQILLTSVDSWTPTSWSYKLLLRFKFLPHWRAGILSTATRKQWCQVICCFSHALSTHPSPHTSQGKLLTQELTSTVIMGLPV